MRRVFADTLYWVALIHRKDQWHQAALRVSRQLQDCHLVTTDEVLVEVLAAFCEAGATLRSRSVAFVRNLQNNPSVTIRPQSRASFLAGLDRYEDRPDKGYSLTDCISMVAMRQGGIEDVLSHDGHFTQEGFSILL